MCGVQPEEEQGDQGGRETVVGEELAASELVAAASACDSAFSSSLFLFQGNFPGKWVWVEIRVQRVPNYGPSEHSTGLRINQRTPLDPPPPLFI